LAEQYHYKKKLDYKKIKQLNFCRESMTVTNCSKIGNFPKQLISVFWRNLIDDQLNKITKFLVLFASNVVVVELKIEACFICRYVHDPSTITNFEAVLRKGLD
jgi:hypothetical protein